MNAFVAAEENSNSDSVQYYALEGLSQLLKNIQMIQKHLNSEVTRHWHDSAHHV